MPRVIKLLRSGKLSDPSIWEGGVTPGPEDVAIIERHVLAIDVPWKLGVLHVITGKPWRDHVVWEYTHATQDGAPVEVTSLVVIHLRDADGH